MAGDPTGGPGGLSAVLKSVGGELISRWVARVRRELTVVPLPTVELMDHMPAFVEELIEKAGAPCSPDRSQPAGQHGIQRLRLGFDVGEVVREYGILHECIIELATEGGYSLRADDQVLITQCLTRGIADAVSQYVEQRDAELQRQASEHMGFIAHEVRNGLATALLAYQSLRQQANEPAGLLERLGRGLRAVSEVVTNALTQSWLRMGVVPKPQPVRIKAFLEELVLDVGADARERRVDPKIDLPADLTVAADPRLLRSAVSNLLTNALKFSPAGSTVTVKAWAAEGRLSVEVLDRCGGLPPGKAEELFSPLVQKHEDRSGFGLGLAIVMQAVEAHGGTAKVRDRPGVGCAFLLDLPLVREGAGDAR